MKPTDLYRKAIALWGLDAQARMLAEEAAELAVAALHFLRGKGIEHLVEELADVRIMVEQLFVAIDGLKDQVYAAETEKLRRLQKRIEG